MSNLKLAVNEIDHTRGAKKPQLSIVEYGDFQCPYCRLAEPFVEQIYKEFGTAVAITFRNFPLSDMHQYATPAAQAAEAAGKQGKYWEMHDAIYQNQKMLSLELLAKLADELNLNFNQFQEDIKSDSIKSKIDNDFEYGVLSGVNGTPSFFVNGTKFDGGAEELYAMIKANAN